MKRPILSTLATVLALSSAGIAHGAEKTAPSQNYEAIAHLHESALNDTERVVVMNLDTGQWKDITLRSGGEYATNSRILLEEIFAHPESKRMRVCHSHPTLANHDASTTRSHLSQDDIRTFWTRVPSSNAFSQEATSFSDVKGLYEISGAFYKHRNDPTDSIDFCIVAANEERDTLQSAPFVTVYGLQPDAVEKIRGIAHTFRDESLDDPVFASEGGIVPLSSDEFNTLSVIGSVAAEKYGSQMRPFRPESGIWRTMTHGGAFEQFRQFTEQETSIYIEDATPKRYEWKRAMRQD